MLLVFIGSSCDDGSTAATETTTSTTERTSTTEAAAIKIPVSPEGPRRIGDVEGPYLVKEVLLEDGGSGPLWADRPFKIEDTGIAKIAGFPHLNPLIRQWLRDSVEGEYVWLEADRNLADGSSHLWLDDGRLLAWVLVNEGPVDQGAEVAYESDEHQYASAVLAEYRAALAKREAVTPTTPPVPTTVPPDVQAALDRIAAMNEANARQQEESRARRERRRQASLERDSSAGDTYYEDCDEARAAGEAPVYRGGSGYRDELDSDSDGVACEIE